MTPSGSSIWRTSTRPKVLTGRYADCGVDGPADVARPLRFFLPPAPTAQLPSSNALPFSTRPLPRLRPARPISLATHPPATSDHLCSGPVHHISSTTPRPLTGEPTTYRSGESPPVRPSHLSRTASCSDGLARSSPTTSQTGPRRRKSTHTSMPNTGKPSQDCHLCRKRRVKVCPLPIPARCCTRPAAATGLQAANMPARSATSPAPAASAASSTASSAPATVTRPSSSSAMPTPPP